MISEKLSNKLKTILRKIEDNYKFRKTKIGQIFNINVDGIQFKMQFKNYPINYFISERIRGVREPETTVIIKSLIHPGNKVLELGGCFGYFTFIMASCVGEHGEVVSIEGTPSYFEILKKNIKLNQSKNIKAFNYFITSKKGNISFDLDHKDPYKAIKDLNENKNQNDADSIKVQSINISEFLKSTSFKPDSIFMDIEGFEVDVIESLSEDYFKFHKPNIVFSEHSDYYQGEKNLDYIINILKRNNYKIRRVSENIICIAN